MVDLIGSDFKHHLFDIKRREERHLVEFAYEIQHFAPAREFCHTPIDR